MNDPMSGQINDPLNNPMNDPLPGQPAAMTDEERYLKDSDAISRDFKKYAYHPMRDKVFAGLLIDKNLCERVISGVTGIRFDIQDINLQQYEPGELEQGRAIVLDIKAVNPAGDVCNIEVQTKYFPGTHEKRVVFHAARLLSKQLRVNEGFEKTRLVIVIFFNMESASREFIRHITLRDGNNALYSDLIRLYEVNTMENAKAGPEQTFTKIFACFLLNACEREQLYRKLESEGIEREHETVQMLLRRYDRLVGDQQMREELKIMEMTLEDRIFLNTRNYADIREEGKKEGWEEGRQ